MGRLPRHPGNPPPLAPRARTPEVDLPPDGPPWPAADRCRAPCPHPPPRPRELALGLAPARVLAGEAEDEGTELGIDRRPAKAARPAVGPLPAYELAVPAEEGCRGDEEGDPSITRDHPTRRREQDPVDRPELGWARGPLQHPELMAEDEDLEVLRVLVALTEISDADEANESPDDKVEERPHRPILPRGPERESGFPTT